LKEAIKQIFTENKKMLFMFERAIFYLKVQNYDEGLRSSYTALWDFSEYVKILVDEAEYLNSSNEVYIDITEINDMISQIMQVQDRFDYVLLCDLYELELIPLLKSVQNAVLVLTGEKAEVREKDYLTACETIKELDEKLYEMLIDEPFEEIDWDNYKIEFSSQGDYTLRKSNQELSLYLHHKNAPVSSSSILANGWYNENFSEYTILGLGLGYHANQLGKIDRTASVHVYESDIHIIQLALVYGVLEEFINNPKHKVYYDSNYTKLIREISNSGKDSRFVIHFPSLQLFQDGPVKTKLEDYFIQYSFIQNLQKLWKGNFRENVKKVDKCVQELKPKFEGRTAYIVAAGPSLDYNMEELRSISEDSVIIAVGTVFRKLVKENIRVDYLIISEADERVIGQISGLENNDTPVLILSTAYFEFADKYNGTKYLVYQEGFEPAEKVAKENGYFLCEGGDSVSTVALDLCIKMGCKRVVAVGLDLAYTNNFVHATDTSRRNISEVKHLMIIKDLHGKEVYTTRTLDMYRQWIEKRIEREHDIEFIDATEGGAYINGMKNLRLADVIELEKRG